MTLADDIGDAFRIAGKNPERKWTREPPTESGLYWNWNGDLDSAPLPTFVLLGGFTGNCFVSSGQLGLTRAIDCDVYGGWWCKIAEPTARDAYEETREARK